MRGARRGRGAAELRRRAVPVAVAARGATVARARHRAGPAVPRGGGRKRADLQRGGIRFFGAVADLVVGGSHNGWLLAGAIDLFFGATEHRLLVQQGHVGIRAERPFGRWRIGLGGPFGWLLVKRASDGSLATGFTFGAQILLTVDVVRFRGAGALVLGIQGGGDLAPSSNSLAPIGHGTLLLGVRR